MPKVGDTIEIEVQPEMRKYLPEWVPNKFLSVLTPEAVTELYYLIIDPPEEVEEELD